MNKIIIYHDMTDLQATYYVMKVIQEGEGQLRRCAVLLHDSIQ